MFLNSFRIQKKFIGITLLVTALLIGYKFLFWNTFIDEGDSFAAGLFVANGKILYKDIFSHHFPFTYYWVALAIKIFGPSVGAVRGSLLVFQISSFAWAMILTRKYVLVGLTALIWNVIGYLYAGNTVLYSVFTGISLTVVFFVIFFILTEPQLSVNWLRIITIGVYSTVAVLSDPLAIYAVGVVLVFVAASKAGLRVSLKILGIILLGGCVYLLYLIITQSFTDFFSSVIVFNKDIYSKYFPANPLRLKSIAANVITFLDIANSQWFNLNLWQPLEKSFVKGIDYWFFTGFLFRLAIIVQVASLWFKKKYVGGGFIFFFAASLLAIHDTGFRFIPFVLMAIVVLVMLGIELVGILNVVRHFGMLAGSWRKITAGALYLVQGMALVMLGWLLFRSVLFALDNLDKMSYQANFSGLEKRAAEVRSWSCGYPDVRLAYYPGTPYIHFFSRLLPVSKYLFMFPWVVEVAQQDVLAHFEKSAAIVYVEKDGQVWSRNNKEYLAPILTYLDQNYHRFGFETYVSEDVYRQCLTSYRLSEDLRLGNVTGSRDGDTLAIDITWIGGEDIYRDNRAHYYTAYVQLLDSSLNRISGSDILLTRDSIQKIDSQRFTQRFNLSIPQTLPSGAYALKIGLYYFENEALIEISSVRVPEAIIIE